MTDQTVMLPDGYTPHEGEEFMCPRQSEYFRRKLLDWKKSIEAEMKQGKSRLRAEPQPEPDTTDRAEVETIHEVEIRTMERERKLLVKIEEALERMENGSYGYCRISGRPIELKRLEARPIATLCMEEQRKHENEEKERN